MASSLTSCLKKAGPLLHRDDRAAILSAARAHRSTGEQPDRAARMAVEGRLTEVRAMLAAAEPALLTSQTPEELRSKSMRERAAAMADQAEQARLTQKATADAEVGDFALTGSDRQVDVGAARGQKGMFDEMPPADGAWIRHKSGLYPFYNLMKDGKVFVQIQHAGHPTAIRPYYLVGDVMNDAPVETALRKYSTLEDAKAAAEKLLADPPKPESTEELRAQLRDAEQQILAAAPKALQVGGGDIERASVHPHVPKGLRMARAELKRRLQDRKSAPADVLPQFDVRGMSEDDALRKLRDWTQESVDAYDPAGVVTKLGDKWTYTAIEGSTHPTLFDTKKAAVESATRHRDQRQQMVDNPSGYSDVTRELANARLERIDHWEKVGKSEMEAGEIARREVPEWKKPEPTKPTEPTPAERWNAADETQRKALLPGTYVKPGLTWDQLPQIIQDRLTNAPGTTAPIPEKLPEHPAAAYNRGELPSQRWGSADEAGKRAMLRAAGLTDLADKKNVAQWGWDNLSGRARAAMMKAQRLDAITDGALPDKVPQEMRTPQPPTAPAAVDAKQVTKLRESGQKLVDAGTENYGRDRLANTARRARMASGAEANAAAEIWLGKKMIAIADALEAGEAPALRHVTTKAHVDMLRTYLQGSRRERFRVEKVSYGEEQKREGEPYGPEDIKYAHLPVFQPLEPHAKNRTLELLKGKRVGDIKRDVERGVLTPTIVARIKHELGDKNANSALGYWPLEAADRLNRFERMGITNDAELRAALTQFNELEAGGAKVDRAKQLERALVGSKVGIDFFPTPKGVAERMVAAADIRSGQRVLEPSAGNGNIAEAIRAASAVEPEVGELSSSLREILDARGFKLVANDFLDYKPGPVYDRILMNPPFSNRQDAAHVEHAFELLRPGGRLVAIIGEGVMFGQDAKAQAFRDFLDANNAQVEKLDANTFSDRTLMATTQANARLVVMNKGVGVAERQVYGVRENDGETDLFGASPVQAALGPRKPPARAKPVGVQSEDAPPYNLFDAPVIAVRGDEHLPGTYYLSSQLVNVGMREVPATFDGKVTSMEQAVGTLQHLTRFAVEHFDVLITDKDGKPLAIIGSFKGAGTQAAVYPAVLLQEALRIEGAAFAYGSHNHPGGNSRLSAADEILNRTIAVTFEPSRVQWKGVSAVSALGTWNAVDEKGDSSAGRIAPPGGTTTMIPIVERQLVRPLDDAAQGANIDSPAKAKDLVLKLNVAGEDPGILFMDNSSRATAWVPIDAKWLGLKKELRFDRLINAASNAGAVIAIIANPNGRLNSRVIENYANALARADVRIMDVIGDETGPVSWAERGMLPVASVGHEVFQLGDNFADHPMGGTAPAEHVEAVRDLRAGMREVFRDAPFEAVMPGGNTSMPKARELAAVRMVARTLFGTEAVFVKFKKGTQPLFNGVMSEAVPGKVFLNVDAQNPLMSVLGHELLHQLRATQPEAYRDLQGRLNEIIAGEEHYRERLAGQYARAGSSLPGNWLEELHADIVGDRFMEPAFWKQLAAQGEPGLLQRIVSAVLKFLDDALAKLGVSRSPLADEFITNVSEARAAVAEAMAKMSGKPAASAGSGVRMSAVTPTAPFYSALSEAVGRVNMKLGAAGAWSQFFKGMVANGSVKQDEITWSGVEDWLKMQGGKVTKADVQKFLDANGVRVTERVMGGSRSEHLARDEQARLTVQLDNFIRENGLPNMSADELIEHLAERREALSDDEEGQATRLKIIDVNSQIDWLHDFEERWDAATVGDEDMRGHDDTIYAQYTLPGGQNYRELLLTLPVKPKPPFSKKAPTPLTELPEGWEVIHDSHGTAGFQWGVLPPGQVHAQPAFGQQFSEKRAIEHAIAQLNMRQHAAWRTRKSAYEFDRSDLFQSNHWRDTSNVLAHIRVTDRTDADGKKVLFVEELQSDWAQQGKRKGFLGTPATAADVDVKFMEGQGSDSRYPGYWESFDKRDGHLIGRHPGRMTEEDVRANALGLLHVDERQRVPSAPFVENTEAWLSLAIKRVVKMAADEGYDRVAFVNGQQSADRYSLSKQVQRIEWEGLIGTTNRHVSIETSAGLVRFYVDKGGVVATDVANARTFVGKPLDEVLGKAAAAKIMGADRGVLAGEGLNIGGEGMKAFYDQIVPNVAKDVVRKLGGGALTRIDLAGSDEAKGSGTPQHVAFDVTPAMRAKVASGAPLFSIYDNLWNGVRGFNQTAVRNAFLDAVQDHSKQPWFHNLRTQYAKARVNPRTFGRVWNAVQDYIKDVSTYSNAAGDLAPGILPKLEDFRDALPQLIGGTRQTPKGDLDAAGQALFRGTLDNVVYSREQLAAQGLSDEQIALYQQGRAAINQSLDDLAKSELVRLASLEGTPVGEYAMAQQSPLQAARVLAEYLADQGADEQFAELAAEKVQQIERLKAEGYAPLMRFGRHTLHITDAEGQTLYFSMHESAADANARARVLAQDPSFEGAHFDRGLMSQDAYKLYEGLPIDALELFARTTGNENNEVYQEFLKLTKSNRSVLKRLIHRKGTEGFDEDLPRVLAAFVTSNARHVSGNLNMGRARAAAEAIPNQLGDVKDDAVRLIDYVQHPSEEAPLMRQLLFVNFLGGSVASAAVNLTQSLTMTLPYLSQWGSGKALGHLMAAARTAATGAAEGQMAQALAIAERNGTVSPQEIHHLTAEAMGKVRSPLARKAAFIWGSLFSLSEQFNRRVAFIAAFNLAQQQHVANPQEFAERAVIETQGLYNKGNRPNWARGPILSTIMTFKQFSIHYLEFLNRMWHNGPEGKKAVAQALGILVLVAGAGGLPFADDLDDLIDTLAQALGYDFSSKKAKREFVAKTLGMGETAGDVATRGLSGLSGFPIDVSLRMGLGNLLPATGILLRSNTDRSRDVLELGGAAGSFGKQVLDAAGQLLAGEPARAAMSAAPKALRDIGQGIQMWNTGEYRNQRGLKVMETDEADAIAKAIGFQPGNVAKESARMGELQRRVNLAKNVTEEIASEWARALNDGDSAGAAEARAKLRQWNEDNPDTRLHIAMQSVIARVRNMRMDRSQRTLKSAPIGLRPEVQEALQ